MSSPIRWRSKILLVEMEGTYGVDPAPAAANAMLAINLELSPMEGEDVSRDLETAHLGGQPEIPTGLRSTLTFTTELQGSGAAGTAPAWGSRVLCGPRGAAHRGAGSRQVLGRREPMAVCGSAGPQQGSHGQLWQVQVA